MRQAVQAVQADPIVDRFVTTAKEYCCVLEDEPALPQGEFLGVVLNALVNLYSAGLQLLRVPADADSTPLSSIGLDARMQFKDRLVGVLGGEYMYRLVSNPLDLRNSESVVATLLEDLSDIYFDIEGNLLSGLWEWKFRFQTHWGRHAATAIYSLHTLLVGNSSSEWR